MTTPELQSQVAALLGANAFLEAAQLISDAIADQGESSPLWNDWAVVQYTAGHLQDAERALRRALRLDSSFAPAAENLGTLLFSTGRPVEALPYLLQAHQAAQGPQRELIAKLIVACESGIVSPSPQGVANV